jgi:hypothetical protein
MLSLVFLTLVFANQPESISGDDSDSFYETEIVSDGLPTIPSPSISASSFVPSASDPKTRSQTEDEPITAEPNATDVPPESTAWEVIVILLGVLLIIGFGGVFLFRLLKRRRRAPEAASGDGNAGERLLDPVAYF